MKEELIAFDVDGVLANFTRGFTRIGNRLFSSPVGDAPSQKTWMFEHFPQLGLDKAMCDEIWRILDADPKFWENLDPFNPSIMPMIDRIKNKVFITNRRGVEPLRQTVAFLEKWGVKNPQVVVAAKKGPVAVDLNVKAILDDYFPNVVDIKQAVPDAYAVLLHTPYNETHHQDWMVQHKGHVALSVDQFIDGCNVRGLIRL